MEETLVEQHSSFFDMVTASGPIAFAVLVTLLILSVISWAIMIAKALQFKKAQDESKEFRNIFFETKNFARIDDSSRRLNASPLVGLFGSGYRELVSLMQDEHGGVKGFSQSDSDFELVERALRRAQLEEVHRLEKGMTFLATVASSAPFIGLFGTVIGIMNAFHSLTFAKNTTIQAVAPGISEALFATAVGLVAAIPAAIAYNYFASVLKKFRQGMEGFVGDFMTVARRSFARG